MTRTRSVRGTSLQGLAKSKGKSIKGTKTSTAAKRRAAARKRSR